MKIPEKLKIGPFNYNIKFVDIVIREEPTTIGQVEHDKQLVIEIDKNLHPERQKAVFLHELIHCVDFFMHIGLTEKQVEQLENGLYMVLKDNGLLRED